MKIKAKLDITCEDSNALLHKEGETYLAQEMSDDKKFEWQYDVYKHIYTTIAEDEREHDMSLEFIKKHFKIMGADK